MEQSPSLRTLVFIPAWNEEASVDAVIADVRAHLPEADILVVDDGSTDTTTARAQAAGVLVATLPFNQGLGAALQTGYLWALREGYDFCAHLDADGQHPPTEVARLLAEVQADRADLVIGSRYAAQTEPLPGAEAVEPQGEDYRATWSRRIMSRISSMKRIARAAAMIRVWAVRLTWSAWAASGARAALIAPPRRGAA
jgi:glycosyltransferase involved in cell wall biosynthesis